ncbi:hypothetical protein C1N70_13305 [Cytobacillus firmus]
MWISIGAYIPIYPIFWKLTEGWLVSCAHFLLKLLDCVLFVLINSIKLNKLDSDIEKNRVFKR